MTVNINIFCDITVFPIIVNISAISHYKIMIFKIS